jgi:Flp pilus assembly protein TadG
MMKRQINHQKQRGVAAVEFALLIIPMLVMVFGITEYGRAMYQYNTLVKSTRDAARFLSTQAAGSGVATAKCLAVYGQKVCSGPKVVSNLDVSMVYVCDSVNSVDCSTDHSAVATGSGVVNLATVVIRGYQFESVVSFNVGGLSVGLPNVTFGDISTTMRQVL